MISKKIKKFFSILLIQFLLISNLGYLTFAKNLPITDNFSAERKIAEQFLKKINHESTVSNPIKLNNVYGELEAICFHIDNGGYIIVNTNDLSIPELSLNNECYYKDNNKQYVYNGSLNYLEETNDGLVSLYTNKVVSIPKDKIYKREKKNKEDIIRELEKNDNQIITPYNVISEKYLSTPLKTYSFNPNGICGSVAAAIVFMFYDEVVSDLYVDSKYENGDDNGTGSVFINYLVPLIDGTEPGSKTGELATGLTNYLHTNRRIGNSAVSTSTFDYYTIKSRINANRPVIIDTNVPSEYGEHWVICHGYYSSTSSTETNQFVIINDGHGRNGIWVDPVASYFHDLVYLYY